MASERIQRRKDQLLDQTDEAVSRSDWHLVRDRVQTPAFHTGVRFSVSKRSGANQPIRESVA